MEQNRFDIIREKLSSIKEVTVGIENFTHKQTELFEALNDKFPNIEQFSNALRDANELLMFAESIQADADTCIEHLRSFQNDYVSEFQKKSKIIKINKVLNGISLELDNTDSIDVIKQELEELLSKIGRKK
ncbi:MAG: hypothetical protein LBI78_03515 [Campylobacteraceae bacterium]|jgi:cell fate (sporulation/competence/biofilm development) regulator YmcA (YheA/YmcA/DUF963 family)|nr:hypothetical protein [Campylobacteraceae bacterium]